MKKKMKGIIMGNGMLNKGETSPILPVGQGEACLSKCRGSINQKLIYKRRK